MNALLLASLAIFVIPGDEDLTSLFSELKAVQDVSDFDLGSIPEKEVGDWVVMRIRADKSSGNGTVGGPYLDATGKVITPKNSRTMVVYKGEWDHIDSLLPLRNPKPKGSYYWTDPRYNRAGLNSPGEIDRYQVVDDGGFVMAQHFPDKAGKDQFGKIVVLTEELARSVRPAYEYYRKSPEVFGKLALVNKLVLLLKDKNPMLAILAAQRLANADLLTGEVLKTALTGPVDVRRSVAFYLSHCNEGEERHVSPEVMAAIRAADAKGLRLIAIGAYVAYQSPKGNQWNNAEAVLDNCRARESALTLDKKLSKLEKKELDFLFDCSVLINQDEK